MVQIKKEEGETDIHKYVLSHKEKYVKELIKNAGKWFKHLKI